MEQGSPAGKSDGEVHLDGSPQHLASSFEEGNSQYGELALAFEAHNSLTPEEKLELDEERAKRRRGPIWHRWWFWVTLLLLIALLIFFLRPKKKSGAGAKGATSGAQGSKAQTGGGSGGRGQTGPAAITVGQSKTGDMPVYVEALGTVTPTYTVTVYSQITGRVIAVHYREGQTVRKGDPLIDIDPRPYQATLTQAEGTLEHDQALLAEAQIDLERYRQAFARNAIARQQLEDQEQTVLQDQGTVKTDQGAVDYDKVQLSYCHIVAPITGKVGLRLVDPGNTVFSGTGSTLVVITQVDPITVVFNVSEDDLPQVQEQLHGGKTLTVDAFDRADTKKIASGKLTSLDNEVDTTTGTIKFRANYANPGMKLYPNQFVNARLLVKTLNGAVLVPTAAVQHNGTQAFVYIVSDAPAGQGKPKEPAGGKDQADAKEAGAGGQAKPAGANKTVKTQAITEQTSDGNFTAVTGIPSGVNLATSGFDRLENGADVLVNTSSGKAQQGHGSNGQTGGSTGGSTAP